MTVQEQTYTVEEFLKVAQSAEYRDQRLELINGEICVMSPSSSLNASVALRIGRFLDEYVEKHNLGYATGADGGYRLGHRNVLVPDVAFISAGRTRGPGDNVFEVAPDLAVEVISPSETNRQVLDKARAYLQAGTELVWAVYPREQLIDVIRLTGDDHLDIETLTIEGVLSGGDVLPGFEIPVKSIFSQKSGK